MDNYRDPFGYLQPHRNSDVDFTDVFGGPPRRSSIYDLRRRSRADSLDIPFRPTSVRENPAFGSPGRRRGQQKHLGDGFFDDIFPGIESGGETPRKFDKDGFPVSSVPGSRVLSPNRAGFVGGSARIASPNSPPMNLAKGVNHSDSGSPSNRVPFKYMDGPPDVSTFPASPNTSFFGRVFPPEDDMRRTGHVVYKQSPLAGQGLRGMHSQYHKDLSTLDSFISKNQFHFSIYKWAGKGVSLAFSSSSKEKSEIVSELRNLPEVVIKAVDFVSDDDDMSTTTATSNIPCESQDNSTSAVFMEMKDNINSRITDDLPDALDSKNFSKSKSENSASSGTRASITRNLQQFFADSFEEQGYLNGNTERTEESYESQKNAKGAVKSKKQTQRENKLDQIKDLNKLTEENQTAVDEKMTGNKVKGKVKDFIKIFSNEGAPKRKSTFETEGKFRGKDRVKNKAEDQVGVSTKNGNDKISSSLIEEGAFVFDSAEINERSRNHDTTDSCENSYNSSFFKTDADATPKSFSELNQETVTTPVHKAASPTYDDLERCLVEQKPEENGIDEKTVLQRDEIRMADAKVREWSKGKEGNIRSLLSTLQYVLWTGSRWKPVPLVDIIEGTSVKKAYQRALLCLHPDKLQQRGAATMQQKYIAEKVFDILQEAWDQFNSVTVF